MTKCYCLILVLFLLACERETILDIPLSEPKDVVNAIFEANKPAQVFVGYTSYTMDMEPAYNSSAKVIIGVNAYIDTLIYIDSGRYVSTKTICTANTNYKVKVELSEGNNIETIVQIPPTVKFCDYNLKIDVGINSIEILTVKISDNANQSNNYMLLLESHSTNDSINRFQKYVKTTQWYSYSPIIMAEGSEEQNLFSDILFNGDTASIPMNFHLWDYAQIYDLDFIVKCYLITLDKAFYKYNKSLSQYLSAMDNVWLNNSPPQVYGNIEGVLGVAGGYNVSDSIIIEY